MTTTPDLPEAAVDAAVKELVFPMALMRHAGVPARDEPNTKTHEYALAFVEIAVTAYLDALTPTAGQRMTPESIALAAVRELHRPRRIYDDCGHTHTGDELGGEFVWEVPMVGAVCEAGFVREVCVECCTTPGEDQSEACAAGHDPVACYPCPTVLAIETVATP